MESKSTQSKQAKSGVSIDKNLMYVLSVSTRKNEEEVRQAYFSQACVIGEMPKSKSVTGKLITSLGFVPCKKNKRFSDFLTECNKHFSPDRKYLVKISQRDIYISLFPNKSTKTYAVCHLLGKNFNEETAVIGKAWLYCPEKECMPDISHDMGLTSVAQDMGSYILKNTNSQHKIIGDCAVRALSTACNLTWSQSVMEMAKSSDYRILNINSMTNIQATLDRLHLLRHFPLRRNGKLLTGEEFCNEANYMFTHGERIYAFVGRSHCAAIVPVINSENMFEYRLVDTWDSSKRRIHEFWIYDEGYAQRCDMKQSTPKCRLSKGDTIEHPTLGNGTVSSITSSGNSIFVEVDFIGHKSLTLAYKYIMDYCKVA